METAISKDGTRIAYDRTGSGPALILVDGALCSRAFGPMPALAPILAKQFTVYTYDRRGRGDSGDTKPYTKAREVEDLEALVQAAGGSAYVLGISSGAALALEGAASGLRIPKVAAYEPPWVNDGTKPEANHQANLEALVAADKRGEAVKYFMRKMVNVPAIFVFIMSLVPSVWKKLKAVAHTLPYDSAVMGDFSLPAARLATITTPTLILHGGKTEPRIMKAATGAAAAVPGARHEVLAGQTHNVQPQVLAPAVTAFFTA